MDTQEKVLDDKFKRIYPRALEIVSRASESVLCGGEMTSEEMRGRLIELNDIGWNVELGNLTTKKLGKYYADVKKYILFLGKKPAYYEY